MNASHHLIITPATAACTSVCTTLWLRGLLDGSTAILTIVAYAVVVSIIFTAVEIMEEHKR